MSNGQSKEVGGRVRVKSLIYLSLYIFFFSRKILFEKLVSKKSLYILIIITSIIRV